MSIVTGITAARTGFELLKSLRELVKRPDFDPGDLAARLLELQDYVFDAKVALNEAQDEKAKLEARIAELTRMADFGKHFKKGQGVYWHDKYPFCPTCWDVDRKPVRLTGPGNLTHRGRYLWSCPLHRADFPIPYRAEGSEGELDRLNLSD